MRRILPFLFFFWTLACSGSSESDFERFARQVAHALEERDSSFFEQRLLPAEVRCGQTPDVAACRGVPSDVVVKALPVATALGGNLVALQEYAASLDRWLQGARDDRMDAYGSGAPMLHALSRTAMHEDEPLPAGPNQTVITAILDTPEGPMRQVRVLTWKMERGGWRLVHDTVFDNNSPPWAGLGWLLGDCEGCRGNWKRWLPR